MHEEKGTWLTKESINIGKDVFTRVFPEGVNPDQPVPISSPSSRTTRIVCLPVRSSRSTLGACLRSASVPDAESTCKLTCDKVSDRVTRPYYWQLHRIEAHQAQSETTVDPSKEDEDDDNDHIPGELGIIRRDVHVLAGFWEWSAKS